MGLPVHTEAHAEDEWPISSARYNPSGEAVSILQHTTLEGRLLAAKSFHAAFDVPFPILVDGIDNAFEAVFCTWPFRFYVVHHGCVVFQSQPRDCTYHLEPLIEALDRF